MDELLDRYLDGELDENEAATFLAALRRDPALERELRAYERMLEVANLPAPPADPTFTDEVMSRIAEAEKPGRGARVLFFGQVWAAAAMLVVAFGLGTQLPRFVGRGAAETEPAGTAPVVAATPVAPDLQLVRLVHVPESDTVRDVTVAGTFNGWDAVETPLRQEDGVWTVVLALPPGSHEYVFVENGETWVTDRLALSHRDDGFGGRNAVLDLTL